jgi:hypothetical protein
MKTGYAEITITDITDGENGLDGVPVSALTFNYRSDIDNTPDKNGDIYVGESGSAADNGEVWSNVIELGSFNRDSNGVDRRSELDKIVVGNTLTFVEDSLNWATFKVNSIDDTSTNYIVFQVELLSSLGVYHRYTDYKFGFPSNGVDGEDGYTPIKGFDYFDGVNGVSVKLQYSVNGSTNWHDTYQSGDFYIRSGTLTPPDTTYVYGPATKFVPEKGVQYDDGIDGLPSYIHIAYADDASGSGFSQSPTGKEYLGSYTDSNPTDSNNPNDYTWVKIKGEQGPEGPEGPEGQNGLSVYFASIFRRSSSGLFTPSDGSYNFDTKTLTPPTNWFTSIPAGTDPVYTSTATASIEGNSGVDSTLTWSPPVVIAQNGEKGIDGGRGPGRWNIPVTILPTDNTSAQAAWDNDSTVPDPPIKDDQAWFYTDTQSNPTSQAVFIYNGISWFEQNEVIDGNLLVTDTITASKLYIKDLSKVFLDSFESETSISEWFNSLGNGELSIETDPDSELGGFVLKIGDNLDNDQVWLSSIANIPFDPNITYKIKVRAKQTLGTGTAYFGLVGVAADGTTLVNITGVDSFASQHYHVASGTDIPPVYTTYTGYTKGFGLEFGTSGSSPDSDSAGKMHPDVRYIRPVMIVNYNGQSGITYVDYMSIESMAGADLIVDGAVTADKLNVNQLDAVSANIGTFQSAASGARLVIKDDTIEVYDDSNNLRVKIGNLA